jgi:hypothetical protein
MGKREENVIGTSERPPEKQDLRIRSIEMAEHQVALITGAWRFRDVPGNSRQLKTLAILEEVSLRKIA